MMKSECWKEHEDKNLLAVVNDIGSEDWNEVSARIKTKSADQCKFRHCYLMKQSEGTPFSITSVRPPPRFTNRRNQIIIDAEETKGMDEESKENYEKTCKKLNDFIYLNQITLNNNNVCDWEESKDRDFIDQIISKGKYDWELLENNNSAHVPYLCKLRWSLLGLGPIDTPFTEEEDKEIIEWAYHKGINSWDKATTKITLRTPKQIAERYKYLEASGLTLVMKNSKRAQKRYSKITEESSEGYNFDRILSLVSQKKFSDFQDFLQVDKINTIFDNDQKTIFKRVAEKSGLQAISDSIKMGIVKEEFPKAKSQKKTISEPIWTVQENQIIFKAYQSLGPNWKGISGLFINRFPKNIKAHFIEVLS